MKYTSSQEIRALALTSRSMNKRIYAPYSIFWKDLLRTEYDPLETLKDIDCIWLFQARHWAQLVLRRGNVEFIEKEWPHYTTNIPPWKIRGRKLGLVLLDLLFENGVLSSPLIQES